MKKIFFALAMLFATNAVSADYKIEIEKFFNLYERGKQVEALESIYSSNKWVGQATDTIQNLKNQLRGIQELLGTYHGNTFIGEHKVAERFVHVTYLALHDRQPIRMEFQFYKPANEWIIYSFQFDDKFDDELEVAARAAIAQGKK